MNTSLLLRNLPRSSTLQSFAEYRELEAQNQKNSSCTNDGVLLEYETLELRLNPPNVAVDNDTYDDRTVITVDSANRSGTLVEVVQCLTELGLNICKARISSDGGWFVDEFHVQEYPKARVTDEAKLSAIRKVLNVSGVVDGSADSKEATTVYQVCAKDHVGGLSEICKLLMQSGFEVKSAAAWTYNGRAACVMGVHDLGQPLSDPTKQARLRQILKEALSVDGTPAHVTTEQVVGAIHHERRLHQMLLREDQKAFKAQLKAVLAAQRGAAPHGAPSTVSPSSESSTGSAAPAAAAAPAQHLGRHAAMADTVAVALQTAAAGSSGSDCDGTSGALVGAVRALPAAAHGAATPGVGHGGRLSSAPIDVRMPDRVRVPERDIAPGSAVVGSSDSGTDLSDMGRDQDWVPVDWTLLRSPKHSRPQVSVQACSTFNYWLVRVVCKDRNKLFFDTVCTLDDLAFDVFHGAIDSEDGQASQLYYVRPRFGSSAFASMRAELLRRLLESAVQRRFPEGLKVHVSAADQACLADLFSAFKDAGMLITRAKVRPFEHGGHTFYLMASHGGLPDRGAVQRACEAVGGQRVEVAAPSPGSTSLDSEGRFNFAFISKKMARTWAGSTGSVGGEVDGSPASA